jgi:aryl-alcohol dehydrogenase-like predicted oxidoreductase
VTLDRLDRTAPVARMGLGLAAVGRPGYINLGRERDLPAERSVDALRERCHQLLDAAYRRGVRYFDVARSYGRAEEFLAGWLPGRPDAVVGSKWGYTYTAGWRVDAEVHERKDHGVATYERQLAETRALLGARLDAYHIHSVTLESGALTDRRLHLRLAALATEGVTVGLSVSGPGQRAAIEAALGVEVDGVPLFRSVQATWNLLEPSAGPALAAAHAAGLTVIVKEGVANGRLAGAAAPPEVAAAAAELDAPVDAVALAAALHQPWAGVVLSGAATTDQLDSNLRALDIAPGDLDRLGAVEVAEPVEVYWQRRSALPWH